MPRKLRIQFENSIYHVIIRGNNRQTIFYENTYFEKFLTIVEESIDKYKFEVYAYCLMRNHVHFLMLTKEIPISKIMQSICSRYALWYNKMENHIGHVFQGRYKSILVNDDSYCIELCRYIHLNPVKANIVKKPNDYPWSSHRYYLTSNNRSFVNRDKVLKILHERLNINYKKFIHLKSYKESWSPDMQINKNGEVIINDTIIKMNTEYKPKENTRYIPEKNIISTICHYFQIKEEQLHNSRKYQIIEIRAICAYFMSLHSNMSITNIAKYFNRAKSNISYQIQAISQQKLHYTKSLEIKKIQKKLKNLTC